MPEQHLHALPEGHRIEEYEIIRVLGVGGFGITYLAFDHKLDGPVALKEYFPAGIAARADDRQVTATSTENRADFAWGLDRFIAEARAIHKFQHPNVVRAHRYVEADDTAYIVMDYVEGESLSAILETRGSLSVTEWRPWLDRLLDGLAHVHAHGFLHRDIKPANIVIRAADGEPVLIDFGAARLEAAERTHTQMFTPEYAPIEQHGSQGTRQGPPADIYALAAVSYRVLTGAPPPSAPDRMLDDQCKPLAESSQRTDQTWLAAIDRGLALRPDDRPQTVAAWNAALREVDATSVPDSDAPEATEIGPVTAHDAPAADRSMRTSNRDRAIAGVVLAIAVVMMVWPWLPDSTPQDPPITTASGPLRQPTPPALASGESSTDDLFEPPVVRQPPTPQPRPESDRQPPPAPPDVTPRERPTVIPPVATAENPPEPPVVRRLPSPPPSPTTQRNEPSSQTDTNVASATFFTRGSHADDVLRIQGTPTSIDSFPALGFEIWSYGNNSVTISTSSRQVTEWTNHTGGLQVQLIPGTNIAGAAFFTRGSHADDVLRIQGTPTSIDSFPALGFEIWSYGNNSVTISTSSQQVTEWANHTGGLKARLIPGTNVTGATFFTRGSHADDVLRIQGTPTDINSFPALGFEIWSYGNNSVTISTSSRQVTEWANHTGGLKVRLIPGTNITGATFFTRGSHADDVLRIQGTPTDINSFPALGFEIWSYGNNSVTISTNSRQVTEWANRTGELKVR